MQTVDVVPIGTTAPEPLHRPTATLTPRGHAAVTVVRLKGQLIALDDADRAWILELLSSLVADVDRTA
jgi:hypothetical protein